jgi:hypothetical protein
MLSRDARPTEFGMLLDKWWLYAAGTGLVAWVVFQAWDRRHNAEWGARQEKGRVDREAARQAEGIEYAKQARPSMKS